MTGVPRLGERGQGWVWGQFLLAGVVVLTAALSPRWAETATTWIGVALILAGGGLGLWSLSALGGSLSPYPKPRRAGELVEHGPASDFFERPSRPLTREYIKGIIS